VGPNTVRIYNPIYRMSAPIVEFGTLDASFIEGGSLTIPLDDYATDADTSDSQLRWTVSGNRNININIDATTHQARLTAGTDWIGGEILQFMATDPEGNRGSDAITARVLRDDNDPPVILSKDPNTTTANVGIGSSRSFSITAMDPDYDPLNITWRKGGTVVAENTFSYSYADSDGVPHPLSVIVSDGTHETAEAWDINLVEPIGTVDGTVRERGTLALMDDVLVELLDEGSTITVGRTGTDAAGHYSITIHEGRYDLRFTKAGYHEVLIRGIVVNPGETLTQDAEMSIITGRGTVQGTVTDSTDSSLIRDALVEAVNSTGIVGSAPTDASGHYTMELGEGTYTLRFSKIGYAMREVAGVAITSDATTTQDVSLERSTATIGAVEGTVRESGTSVALQDVLVEIKDGSTVINSTTTSATGSYHMEVLGGIYDIAVSGEGHRASIRRMSIPAGATTIADFTLDKWWDDAWQYLRPIYLTSGEALTDYVLELNISYSAGMKADFSDLRFVDADQTTLLDYWIEQKIDGEWCKVWVEFRDIGLGASRSWMYYGNAAASSTSNGTNTFILWDDFGDGTLNPVLWRDVSSTGARVIEGSGQATLQYGGDKRGYLRTLNEMPLDIELRFDAMLDDANAQFYTYLQWDGTHTGPFDTVTGSYVVMDDSYAGQQSITAVVGGTATGIGPVLTIPRGFTFNKYRLNRYNGNYEYWLNGERIIWGYNETVLPSRYIGFTGREIAAATHIDNVMIRKFVSPEPTYGVGTEESR
ncbi:DUF2341 domain-containing protein, partial [archaeon]|nr:DUF2341 domain-containing protein [archaeon]